MLLKWRWCRQEGDNFFPFARLPPGRAPDKLRSVTLNPLSVRLSIFSSIARREQRKVRSDLSETFYCIRIESQGLRELVLGTTRFIRVAAFVRLRQSVACLLCIRCEAPDRSHVEGAIQLISDVCRPSPSSAISESPLPNIRLRILLRRDCRCSRTSKTSAVETASRRKGWMKH